jgi:ketosteroid isomerase-like protein
VNHPDLPYFRDLYDAFNRRDVDTLLATMTDDVDWPNAWRGGRLRGRDAVREYWKDQWAEIDSRAEPRSVERSFDGRLAVSVRQTVRSSDGAVLSDQDVVHVYELRGRLIAHMNVEQQEPPAA